jgi:hypothetical protein
MGGGGGSAKPSRRAKRRDRCVAYQFMRAESVKRRRRDTSPIFLLTTGPPFGCQRARTGYAALGGASVPPRGETALPSLGRGGYSKEKSSGLPVAHPAAEKPRHGPHGKVAHSRARGVSCNILLKGAGSVFGKAEYFARGNRPRPVARTRDAHPSLVGGRGRRRGLILPP